MYHKRAKKIVIDEEKCIGCKKCIQLCTSDVIRFDNDNRKAVCKYTEDCEACLLCEVHCPTDAIRVTPVFPIYVADPFR